MSGKEVKLAQYPSQHTDPVDVVLYQPASEMVASASPGHTKKNPSRKQPKRNPGRKKKSAWQIDESEILHPYAGVEHLLVRTAIVRSASYSPDKLPAITCPRDVTRLLAHLRHDPQENFVVLCMDSQNRVIAIYPAFVGTGSQTLVAPEIVFRVPLLLGAQAFIVAHNHPSGVGTPSKEDLDMTAKLKSKALCVGLTLLDHVIIGHDRVTSLMEEGLM